MKDFIQSGYPLKLTRAFSFVLLLLLPSGLMIWSGLKTLLFKENVPACHCFAPLRKHAASAYLEMKGMNAFTQAVSIPDRTRSPLGTFNWPVIYSGTKWALRCMSTPTFFYSFPLLRLFPSCMPLQPSRPLNHLFEFLTNLVSSPPVWATCTLSFSRFLKCAWGSSARLWFEDYAR